MTAPSLRSAPSLRRAPACQPPYDDELPEPHLRMVPAYDTQLPFEPDPLVRRRSDDAVFGRQPTGRHDLPDPGPWARRFLQAVLESLSGRRPAAQLQPWTSNAVYAGVQQACAAGQRPRPESVIRSVHVSEPADGVAEVCAVIARPGSAGVRCSAVAARLEGFDGRWRCVTLQVG
ncbi:hypothetical protein BH20ACT5_BH20ACT5_22990 [soil metagenome]